eukprot:5619956-Amphidinium_carterae.2
MAAQPQKEGHHTDTGCGRCSIIVHCQDGLHSDELDILLCACLFGIRGIVLECMRTQFRRPICDEGEHACDIRNPAQETSSRVQKAAKEKRCQRYVNNLSPWAGMIMAVTAHNHGSGILETERVRSCTLLCIPGSWRASNDVPPEFSWRELLPSPKACALRVPLKVGHCVQFRD